MKEFLNFLKILVLATIGSALMLMVAAFAASVLSAYNKEIVVNIIISIVAVSVILPMFFIDSKKEWLTITSLVVMAYTLIQSIMIVGLL